MARFDWQAAIVRTAVLVEAKLAALHGDWAGCAAVLDAIESEANRLSDYACWLAESHHRAGGAA